MLAWFALFALTGAAGTWAARRYALSRALIDQPGERRSHSVPTPRGGGVAIVVALLVAASVLALREPGHARIAIAFAAGLFAVALVGLVDDHRPLSPWLRLCVHVVAAATLALAWMWGGGDWAVALVAFAACVSLTNVWNFMDGINGLAASQAAIAAFAFAALAADGRALVPLALAASCVGFLPFNFPRSRIFLGDVGSGALGFSIGATWLLVQDGEGPASILMAMAASAFVLDAGLTLLRRMLRGEPWWTPHVQHAYQVCARRWGHARVTFSYGAWTAASILMARALGGLPAYMTWAVVAVWYTGGALLWLWLQHRNDQCSPRDRFVMKGTGQAGHE